MQRGDLESHSVTTPRPRRVYARTLEVAISNFKFLIFNSPKRVLPTVLALVLILILSLSLDAKAQPASPPPAQDPLMSLMLSQPKIDIESPVKPISTFDPPVVKPGEQAILRITFNALEESIEMPASLPVPAGVQVEPGGHGQMLSMAGATFQPRTSFNYRLSSKSPGQIIIPSFTATVYGQPVTVPAAQLEISTAPPPSLAPAQILVLEVPQTNLFVGQAVPVSILFPGVVGIAMQGQAPVQLTGQGFVADLSTFRPRFEPRPHAFGKSSNPVFIYEGILTPIAAGKISFFAQSFVATRPSSPGVVGIPAVNPNLPIYTLLDSDPLNLEVRALPRSGRLPGFNGAVGVYSVSTPELGTNLVRVGDPLRLSVKVRGEGNLLRLVPPPPPRARNWQVLAGPADTSAPQIIQAQGFTTFNYILIPLSDKARYTPAIPFSCFDPQQELYRDLTIPSVAIMVKPGLVSADLLAIQAANAANVEPEKEPTLSDLATSPGMAASLSPIQRQLWFPLLQLLPAAALAGLWGWDRRRRYFEKHPDELLRRRARRALRRERRALQSAARAGDAPRFATTVASALRIACAPHYPAEPRALVGSDVLALLPESERSGRAGTVVRHFFTVLDADRFGVAPQQAGELLELEPDLERILEQLEDRL